jgi:SPP1 family predicted phage head-tail adaptor
MAKRTYRHKITFIKQGETVDDRGEIVQGWAPIYGTDIEKSSAWADIKPLRGREFWSAQQSNSEIEGVIYIRYRSDIKEEYRIQKGDRQLEILNIIDPDEKHIELQIQYKEVQ